MFLSMLSKDRLTNAFLSIAGVVVLVVILFGFMKTGSPTYQRDLASDNQRIQDVTTLSQEIYTFVNPGPKPSQTIADTRPLPASLDELPQVYSPNPKDPVSGAPYEYVPQRGTAYELCATFSTEATGGPNEAGYNYGPRIFSTHPIGHYCFALDASKSPYETPMPVPESGASVPIQAKPVY
jgi:hypothetical protein